MGSSSGVAQFARKMDKAADAVKKRQAKATGAAALAAKDIFEQEAARSGLKVGSTLAGKPWKGYNFRVKAGSNPTALVRTRGPAWLHDSDTEGHPIFPRRSGAAGFKRSRKGATALKFGGRHAAYVSFHPGTKGKGWSKKAKKRIEKRSPEAYQRELSRSLRDIF